MVSKSDGERLAVVENQMITVSKKLDAVDASISSLHTKMDTLVTTFHENYVSKGEFEEWKKSKTLEKVLYIIITAAITSLITFFVTKVGMPLTLK